MHAAAGTINAGLSPRRRPYAAPGRPGVARYPGLAPKVSDHGTVVGADEQIPAIEVAVRYPACCFHGHAAVPCPEPANPFMLASAVALIDLVDQHPQASILNVVVSLVLGHEREHFAGPAITLNTS
jgi:hypothetical protein